ncbi:MAG: hypothetical protein IJZ47_00335 [Oscillospiraceae bacterium]|nr:hypothetical protein [Oscillospiraceae bacterium]
MDSFTINMKNSTQAYKARMVLARRGIRSMVQRTHHPRAGCSFALRVFGREKEVCALLGSAGIPCDISR